MRVCVCACVRACSFILVSGPRCAGRIVVKKWQAWRSTVANGRYIGHDTSDNRIGLQLTAQANHIIGPTPKTERCEIVIGRSNEC